MTVCLDLDKRILGITPNLAVEWGYNLYLCETLPEKSAVGKNAEKALEELEELFSQMPRASREKTYITTLRLAANSFARGIERRKRMLGARLAAAKEEKDKLVDKYASKEKFGGILTASVKPLLAGGVVLAFLQALFLMRVTQNPGDHEVHRYVSLAFALSVTLISGWVKGWLTGRRLVKLFNTYDAALKKAQEIYSSEVVAEYKLTADSARSAWTQLTGQAPPPDSKAFDTVLIGLMTSCDRDAIAAVHEPEPEPEHEPEPEPSATRSVAKSEPRRS